MRVAFILHGWPKIQNPTGWMNAMGGQGVSSFLQALAALAEFGGGIALALGLLTLIAAFGLVCQMLGALLLVHFPKGDPFVAPAPGASSYELALAHLVMAVLLIALGPGGGRWMLSCSAKELLGERRLSRSEGLKRVRRDSGRRNGNLCARL